MNISPKKLREIGAQALRDNKHKGTDLMLCNGHRCCLCVMQDAYEEATGTKYGHDNHYPHIQVMKAYGFDKTNPELPVPVMYVDGSIRIHEHNAAYLNDGGKVGTPIGGLPHSLIAECLENVDKEPGERKWTFYLKRIEDRLATDLVIVDEYYL